MRSQISVASLVTSILRMLAAVGFDDQPVTQADKVRNIVIDRQLALELVARQTLRAQDLPQAMLSIRLARTHCFGALAEKLRPPPLPAVATRRLSLSRSGERD